MVGTEGHAPYQARADPVPENLPEHAWAHPPRAWYVDRRVPIKTGMSDRLRITKRKSPEMGMSNSETWSIKLMAPPVLSMYNAVLPQFRRVVAPVRVAGRGRGGKGEGEPRGGGRGGGGKGRKEMGREGGRRTRGGRGSKGWGK